MFYGSYKIGRAACAKVIIFDWLVMCGSNQTPSFLCSKAVLYYIFREKTH